MKFEILTIFPNIFDSYFSESLLGKAVESGKIEINVHDLRDYSKDDSSGVDGKPYGGGIGMVMRVGPVYRAIKDIKKEKKSKIVLFTPRGESYNQEKANNYSELDQLILICGRYEGVDERVKTYIADQSISIGDYVLMGGEIPAMVVVESTARAITGVVGKEEKFTDERLTEEGALEYPQYTRPATFETDEGEKWEVPEVLLSGHHENIKNWRKENGEHIK